MSDPAKVRSINPDVDAELVASLEEWLADAKRGELVGAVLLGNRRGAETQHAWTGQMPIDRALVCFEHFKLAAFRVHRD